MMPARSNIVLASLALGMLLAGSPALRAERGSVRGQLTDLQGKPVADAKVTVTQDRDPRSQDSLTGSDGRFVFPSLPAGAYKIVAAALGFIDANSVINVADGVALTVN